MDEPAAGVGRPHSPVLYQLSIEILQPESKGRYVDGTLGAGGHAKGILEASHPDGQLLGLDVDDQALEIAGKYLASYKKRATIHKGSYAEIDRHIHQLGWDCANGIILDLGLSSMQLDSAERGFSFVKEAPLDMRFDQATGIPAEEILNTWDEHAIADIIWKFGEEPKSRQIAREIVSHRPIRTTNELASLVLKAYKGKRGKVHPATRTFQAIRMAVNQELETLEKGLEKSVSALCKTGRLAVISFHSLEDRLVKQFFQRESRDCICPPDQPVCTCGHKANVRILTKKPLIPGKEEIEENPRSRSAKLRAVEKI
jgi:16S rRNA (cytosine1402-N4)-methyltransferase